MSNDFIAESLDKQNENSYYINFADDRSVSQQQQPYLVHQQTNQTDKSGNGNPLPYLASVISQKKVQKVFLDEEGHEEVNDERH